MQKQFVLPIALGIGTGLLLLATLFLLYKLSSSRYQYKVKRPKKSTAINRTPTILPHDIPGFSLPLTRKVPVQEPIRSPIEEPDSDEYDADTMVARTNNNMPISTVLHSSQSTPDVMKEVSKMEPISPLQQKSFNHMKLTGSISLQDLNIYSPKARSKFSLINEDMQPTIKFALYYGVASSELNVTVISVNNVTTLSNLSEEPSLCVWVQVEFSRYHQEFRTKCCTSVDLDCVFHETCVVSDFPADLFNGTKISFRVLDNATVLAEAVHLVLGLPPSFPRNETIELQHPGVVQTSHSQKCGEILVRLKYDPVEETVTLRIVECRNLKSPSKRKKPLDTYVKIHVIFCDEIVQRIKSKLVTKSNNPSFEETFQLSGFFSRGKMKQILVKLTVFSKSVTKQGLGYVFLGTGRQNDITASGYQHWETIIDKPKLDIAQWHALKPVRTITP